VRESCGLYVFGKHKKVGITLPTSDTILKIGIQFAKYRDRHIIGNDNDGNWLKGIDTKIKKRNFADNIKV